MQRSVLPLPTTKGCARVERRGFTLLELVLVLLILSILSVLLALQVRPSIGSATFGYHAQRLAGDLLHARALAMSRGQTLNFLAQAGSYCLVLPPVSSCSAAQAVKDPGHGGGTFNVVLEGGLVFAQPVTLGFDLLGRPLSGEALLSVPVVFELQQGGGSVASVTVAPLTGAPSVAVLQ